MKRLLLLAGVATAALSGAANAGGYLQLHGGVFSQNSDSVEFLGDMVISGDAEADTGFAAGGLLGFYVFPFVAAEGEFTVRTAGVEGDFSVNSVSESFEDDLTTYAYMGNLVFRPEVPLFPLKPYVGAGAGWIQPNYDNLADPDGEFAWQLKAGFNFDLLPTPGMLGLELNYISTGEFDVPTDLAGATAASAEFGGVTGLLTFKVGF